MVTFGLVFLTLTAMHRWVMGRQSIGYSFRQRNKILYAVALGCAIAIMSIVPNITYSQKVEVGKLEIPAGTTYNLEADTLTVDELILKDSAKINLVKPKSYIKANRILIGAGCSILGVGKDGEAGKDGKSFPPPVGVCKPAVHGEPGGAGK